MIVAAYLLVVFYAGGHLTSQTIPQPSTAACVENRAALLEQARPDNWSVGPYVYCVPGATQR